MEDRQLQRNCAKLQNATGFDQVAILIGLKKKSESFDIAHRLGSSRTGWRKLRILWAPRVTVRARVGATCWANRLGLE